MVAIRRQIEQDAVLGDYANQKAFTYRERAILDRATLLAEEAMGSLRVEGVRLEGAVEHARLKGRNDLLAERVRIAGRLMSRFGQFLVTPYADMRHQLGAGGAAPGADVGPNVTINVNPAPAESESAAEGATVAAAGPVVSAPKAMTFSDRLISTLPKWMQVCADAVKRALSRLTPAASAVLLTIVLAGAWYFAEWRKSDVESTLKVVTAEVTVLREKAATYDKQSAEMAAVTGERDLLKAERDGLKQSLAETKSALTDKSNELTKAIKDGADSRVALKDEYQKELAKFSEKLDEATKEKLTKLQAELDTTRAEKDRLTTELARKDEQVKQLAKFEQECATLRTDLASANSTVKTVQDDRATVAGELAKANQRAEALAGFVKSLIPAAKTLVDARQSNLSDRQAEFKRTFKIVFDPYRQMFETEGIPKIN